MRKDDGCDFCDATDATFAMGEWVRLGEFGDGANGRWCDWCDREKVAMEEQGTQNTKQGTQNTKQRTQNTKQGTQNTEQIKKMPTWKKFEDIEVWQLAREFCQDIYRIMQNDGLKTDFALKDQINRSSGSTMDNA